MDIKEFITFLGTYDLNETANFYLNKLELDLYKDQGTCLIFNVTETCKIGFCRNMKVIHDQKSPILTFVTDDVDGVYEHLRRLNVETSQPPQFNPKFKIYHFFLRDPNGYSIEVQKFLD